MLITPFRLLVGTLGLLCITAAIGGACIGLTAWIGMWTLAFVPVIAYAAVALVYMLFVSIERL